MRFNLHIHWLSVRQVLLNKAKPNIGKTIMLPCCRRISVVKDTIERTEGFTEYVHTVSNVKKLNKSESATATKIGSLIQF